MWGKLKPAKTVYIGLDNYDAPTTMWVVSPQIVELSHRYLMPSSHQSSVEALRGESLYATARSNLALQRATRSLRRIGTASHSCNCATHRRSMLDRS